MASTRVQSQWSGSYIKVTDPLCQTVHAVQTDHLGVPTKWIRSLDLESFSSSFPSSCVEPLVERTGVRANTIL